MKTSVIPSKLNFDSVEQIDFVMRQLMAQGNDMIAVTGRRKLVGYLVQPFENALGDAGRPAFDAS